MRCETRSARKECESKTTPFDASRITQCVRPCPNHPFLQALDGGQRLYWWRSCIHCRGRACILVTYGHQDRHRVDGRDLESDDGVHADLGGVRSLLRPPCRAYQDAHRLLEWCTGEGRARDARGSVRSALVGIRTSSASLVARAGSRLREQHVGRVSRAFLDYAHSQGLRRHDRSVVAPVSSSHQATRARRTTRRSAPAVPNVWLRMSIEGMRVARRANAPGAVRFISTEPLLGSLEGLDLDRIHWAIGGSEGEPHLRPCHRCSAQGRTWEHPSTIRGWECGVPNETSSAALPVRRMPGAMQPPT